MNNVLIEKGALKNSLDELIKLSKENVSIIVKEINDIEYLYIHNSETKMISASTIKVPIMLAIFELVKNNKINFSDKIFVSKSDILDDTEVFENGEDYYTLYELINWMIITSDNTSTNILIKNYGMNYINNYILNILGVNNTYIERYMLDKRAIKDGFNNYTTQQDMMRIFTKLFNKEILNDELCDIAIDILYNQRCQDQIMRYIYQPVKFAHKTGELDYLNHDVGVVNINDRLFYVGISVYNTNTKEGNKQLIGNLGKIIYNYLKNNIV